MDNDLTCPQCGGTLIPSPLPEARDMVRAMVQSGHQVPYSQNFAETAHEKEEELGVLHTCGTCRYVTRKGGRNAERDAERQK